MKRIKKFIKKMVPKKYHRKISGAYNYLRSLYFFGFKYQCNFCHGHFRKLLPIGLNNDVAMNLTRGGISLCFMSSMSFIGPGKINLLVYIINKTKILNSSKNIRLLHIAPEKNLQKMLKSFSHIEYISGDLNPLMNCDIRLDITEMSFEDNFSM